MLSTNQQIFEQIKKAKNILIVFSKNWSGDAVSSALAMSLFLKKLDKKTTILAAKNGESNLFSFLPDYDTIQHNLNSNRDFIISISTKNAKVHKIKYKNEDDKIDFLITPKDGKFSPADVSSKNGNYNYDLIIVLDTSDLESIGEIYDKNAEFFYSVPMLNIDHHSENESFGQINKVKLTSVSTTEILFDLFVDYSRDIIDEQIATALLAGMISKTRSFKTINVTPASLSTASQLISMGAEREKIVNKLYRSRSLGVLKLWGRVLARLTNSNNGKFVWSILSPMDFEKTKTSDKDLYDVIDELITSIPEAKIICLVYGQTLDKKNTTSALIFSTKNIDSLILSKELNPIGTKKLSKITLDKPIEKAEKEIISLIQNKINKLPI